MQVVDKISCKLFNHGKISSVVRIWFESVLEIKGEIKTINQNNVCLWNIKVAKCFTFTKLINSINRMQETKWFKLFQTVGI